MPETVKMALSRCYQTITNVTSQGEKLEIVFPLDNGHFITGIWDFMRLIIVLDMVCRILKHVNISKANLTQTFL